MIKKNLYRKSFPRFLFKVDKNLVFMVIQTFKFKHQRHNLSHFINSTGEGASEGGGLEQVKQFYIHKVYQLKILGEGLKVRDSGDVVQLPAKIIKCKRR